MEAKSQGGLVEVMSLCGFPSSEPQKGGRNAFPPDEKYYGHELASPKAEGSTTKSYAAAPTDLGRAEHAEGPMWDTRHRALLWVDQFAGLVHLARQNEAGELALSATYRTDVTVGAVIPLVSAEDGWMLAAGSGFCHLSNHGVVTPVGEPLIDPGQLRMNDGKCDPQGRFWAGSMAWAKTPGAACLYCLGTDGHITVARTKLTISNGSAWTPDGRSMYFIDTPTQRIDRFNVNSNGELRDQETVVQIEAGLGAPDGMCIDDEGCLWVALWGGNAVHRYSPHGELLAVVDVDAPQVSSCTFGGDERSTLFITTSQEGYDQNASDRYPLAGRVFSVELDTTGPDVAPFRGALPVREAPRPA